ncbi:OLC1v1004131C1 [Oldenlandia corymbosa var. corymbosa]|uniref:OLC1v1004131C1 n=1 Tax=Oldenlandia corymbosa var. corymbosa TaxID=529605 RepID=A0AAV1DBI9_OLDCO|nr:OLC1v1004131C1 [Oldenlandia corymbosa var. corymbosa]
MKEHINESAIAANTKPYFGDNKKKSGNKGENEESVGRGGDIVFGTIGEEIKQEPIELKVDVKKEKKKKTETFEDGNVNGAEGEGVGLQKGDKKKKKDRKEKEVEERFGNLVNKGSEADGDNNSKQLNVEVKEEIDRVAEGSVELSDNKKKKKKKMKAEEKQGG